MYIGYINKLGKEIEKEYDSQFKDYRDIDQDEKEKYINEKLSQLPIHDKLKKLDINDVLMNFDATSLYPSAMWDNESIYPRIESGYHFTPDMNDEIVQKFNTQTFTQGSAILKVLYYNPKNLIFQHIPVKETIKKTELNRMRNGYILDTLTSVDIQAIIKLSGRLIKVYEGIIYKQNFMISPLKKVVDKLFKLKQKYKKEKNYLMEKLVKTILNSLYGENIRKDITEKYCCKSEHWMSTQYDENVLDYWKLPNDEYIVKLKEDEGLNSDLDVKITMPSHLGSFILSNSKRIMNNFIRVINGFKTNNIYYTDTDSLYIERKYWDVLDTAKLIGDDLCQGKNDNKSGGIFYGLFLAPKIKYCLTIDEYGIISEYKTFKGFTDSKRLFDRSQYFEMLKGNTVHAKLLLSWKRSFESGIIIPKKLRYCTQCKENLICDDCDKKINQIKEFSHNFIELKRQAPNFSGYMLPWCIDAQSSIDAQSKIDPDFSLII